MKFYLIHLLTVCQVLLEVSCIWIEHFLSFAFRRLFISLEMYLLDSPEFSKTQLFEFLLWKLQKTIFMMIRYVLNFSFFRFYIKTVILYVDAIWLLFYTTIFANFLLNQQSLIGIFQMITNLNLSSFQFSSSNVIFMYCDWTL